MSEEGKQSLKESFLEILLLIKMLIFDPWFWLPVVFTILFYIQILLFFFVHPLLILIGPLILSIYAVRQDRKKADARWRLKKAEGIPAAGGNSAHGSNSSVGERVEKYQELVKNQEEE